MLRRKQKQQFGKKRYRITRMEVDFGTGGQENKIAILLQFGLYCLLS